MTRMAHYRFMFIIMVALLLWQCEAQADETHYDNFRFGQTAIGFGGAVTGFLAEPEATFYNPGGMGFLTRSAFSGALNSFGTERRIIRDWVSINEEGQQERDGISREFVALPTSSVLIKSFKNGHHALGFSTFLLSQTQERFSSSLELFEDDGAIDFTEKLSFSSSLDDRIIMTGPSYGFRALDTLGLGISLFYTRRDQSISEVTAARLITADTFDQPNGYEEAHEQVDAQDGALLMRLGAMWKPNNNWSFGAMVSTPAIHLHGSGRFYYRFINTASELEDEAEQIDRFYEIELRRKAQSQYPWTLGLGASYHQPGRWRLAIGSTLYMPFTYTRMDLSDADESNESTIFVSNPVHELTINASIGGEFILGERWPLRMGLFTNRASSPELNETQLASAELPNVDLYGASFSVGYQGDDAAINFGVESQYGQGHTSSLDASFEDEFVPFLRRDREQYRVLVFISGALNFASKAANEMLEDDPVPNPK